MDSITPIQQLESGAQQVGVADNRYRNFGEQVQREINIEDVPSIAWRWKGRVLAIFALVTIVSAAWYFFGPKHWQAESDIAFIQRATGTYPADESFSAPVVETVDTQLTMLQGGEMANRAVEWLQSDAVSRGLAPDSVTITPDKMQSAISVTNPKDTNIIELNVDARSPIDAVRYSNAVGQAFIAWKQDLARKDASDSVAALEAQASSARTTLRDAEAALLTVQRQSSTLDPAQSEQAQLSRQGAIATAADQYRSDAASATARRDLLATKLSSINTSIQRASVVRDDVLTQSLQTQLRQLQVEKIASAQKYTSAYPGVLRGYDNQIVALNKRLTATIRHSVDSSNPSLTEQAAVLQAYEQAQSDAAYAEARYTSAQNSLAAVRSSMSSMPLTSLNITRQEREVQLAGASYTTVEGDLTSAILALKSTPANVMITQTAITPTAPVSPQRTMFLFVLPMLGLLAGLFASVRAEATTMRVRSLDDLWSLRIGPVVGALPRKSLNSSLSLTDSLRPAAIADAFSIARTNLTSYFRHSALVRPGGKVILITSTGPGEGKSVTASLLSMSYVRAGKSVTLVDANLRTPVLNELLAIDPYPGLSDVLNGTVQLEDVLVVNDETSAFSVLTAGSAVDSGADTLSMPKVQDVVDKLRATSDIVIIDTASCEYSDPFVLAPMADCTMIVVDFERADCSALAQTALAIASQGSPRIALFANNYDKRPAKAFKFLAGEPLSRLTHVDPRVLQAPSNGLNGKTPAHRDDLGTSALAKAIETDSLKFGLGRPAAGDVHAAENSNAHRTADSASITFSAGETVEH